MTITISSLVGFWCYESNEKENVKHERGNYTFNERMAKILQNNEQYQEVQSQIGDQMLLFDELNLDKEQWLIVDRLLSLHAQSGALYGRITYQQGYKDCVALLQAINLIKLS